MFLLEDKNDLIRQYTLPGYTLDQVKAKVWNRKWDQKYMMPTLAYIEVTKELRGRGLALELLKQVMNDNSYLLFQNNNFNFWEALSYKHLPFIIKLHKDAWGELIKPCDRSILHFH